ncbi:MAG: hypothetical protein N2Z85_02620, partial [Patescibacteria group bacterium]|nr:hypothetical protein [Patescibacteria group bacterium]
MKKNNLSYLKNKIKEEKDKYKKFIYRWLIKTSDGYDNGWVGLAENILRLGFVAGYPGFTYLKDTEAIFKKYSLEILEIVEDYIYGYDNLELKEEDTPLYNFFVWLS